MITKWKVEVILGKHYVKVINVSIGTSQGRYAFVKNKISVPIAIQSGSVQISRSKYPLWNSEIILSLENIASRGAILVLSANIDTKKMAISIH